VLAIVSGGRQQIIVDDAVEAIPEGLDAAVVVDLGRLVARVSAGVRAVVAARSEATAAGRPRRIQLDEPAAPPAAKRAAVHRPIPNFIVREKVRLDGVEMTLPEAAERLGVSPQALYFRIYRRGLAATVPNLRAIGADVAGNTRKRDRA